MLMSSIFFYDSWHSHSTTRLITAFVRDHIQYQARWIPLPWLRIQIQPWALNSPNLMWVVIRLRHNRELITRVFRLRHNLIAYAVNVSLQISDYWLYEQTPAPQTQAVSYPPPYDGTTQPGFPVASITPGFSPAVMTAPQASHFPSAPVSEKAGVLGNELVYLGAMIPNPDAPSTPQSKADSQSDAYRVSDDHLLLKSAKKSLGWNEGICKYQRKVVPYNSTANRLSHDSNEEAGWTEPLPAQSAFGLFSRKGKEDTCRVFTFEIQVQFLVQVSGLVLSQWRIQWLMGPNTFSEVVHGRALGPVAYDAVLVRRAVEGALVTSISITCQSYSFAHLRWQG